MNSLRLERERERERERKKDGKGMQKREKVRVREKKENTNEFKSKLPQRKRGGGVEKKYEKTKRKKILKRVKTSLEKVMADSRP